MDSLISVIIPVYNAEKHLVQCIDSILNQKINEIEVILINDGSKDKSADICNQYSKKDSRVKVIHIENSGVSNARNVGIELAKSNYITFVDSDDWIENDTYSDMLELINTSNTEMIINAHYYFDGINSEFISLPWPSGTVFNCEEITNYLIPSYISPINQYGQKQTLIFGSVWKCLFSRKLIIENQITFNKALKYTEDLVFVLRSLVASEKVIINNSAYYYYRNDKKEATATTQKYVEGAYENLKLSQKLISEILCESNQSFNITKGLEARNCLNILANIYNVCAVGSPYKLAEKILVIVKIKKETSFNESIDLVGYYPFGLNQKLLFWLLRKELVFLVIIIYEIRNHLIKYIKN